MIPGIDATAARRARTGIRQPVAQLLNDDGVAGVPPGVALLAAETRGWIKDSVASLERLAAEPRIERTRPPADTYGSIDKQDVTLNAPDLAVPA